MLQEAPADWAGLDEDGKVLRPCDSFFVARRGDAVHQLAWPVHPSQRLYSAGFNDGTRAVLRLPEGCGFHHGSVRWKGEEHALAPYSALEFAFLQLQGTPRDDAAETRAEWDVSTWIAAADVWSLVASSTGAGQADALDFAAQAIDRVLREYKQLHGEYPLELEVLWQGANAVAPIGPANPYAWPEPLAVTTLEASPPAYGLVYFPWQSQSTGEYSAFLLGICGDPAHSVPAQPDDPALALLNRMLQRKVPGLVKALGDFSLAKE